MTFNKTVKTLVVCACLAMACAAPSRADTAWNGDRAMQDIRALVAMGPRVPGTEAHNKAQAYIKQALRDAGISKVGAQTGNVTTGKGNALAVTNIIGRLDPDKPDRILIGTHYDSIRLAYRDEKTPDAPMPGANNGASGVAFLLETARSLDKRADRPFGIDFVFFDGEEGPHSMGEGDTDWMPMGSFLMAKTLSDLYPRGNPKQVMIFDMVCYDRLRLKPETQSLRQAGDLVRTFWAMGQTHAPDIFLAQSTPLPISDDHTPFLQVGLPAFLVIGFEYAPWYNTTLDTPERCSAHSLNAVGATLMDYLTALEKPPAR